MSTADERLNKVMTIITDFGFIDGAHHKQWVLDQVVRAVMDVPMVSHTSALGNTWESQGSNAEYEAWAAGSDEYDEWDTGVAP